MKVILRFFENEKLFLREIYVYITIQIFVISNRSACLVKHEFLFLKRMIFKSDVFSSVACTEVRDHLGQMMSGRA